MAGMWGRLKQFDAYPKTLEDFRVKTYVGASSEWNRARVLCLGAFGELNLMLLAPPPSQ